MGCKIHLTPLTALTVQYTACSSLKQLKTPLKVYKKKRKKEQEQL